MAHPAGSCNRRLHIWGGDTASEMAQPRRGLTTIATFGALKRRPRSPHGDRGFPLLQAASIASRYGGALQADVYL
jgi:hypothetical protein